VGRALESYTSIGFKELARYEDDGLVNFGMVSFGKAELMANMHGQRGSQGASLWFYTDQVDALYQLLKSRQMSAAQGALVGEGRIDSGIEFEQDIENMFLRCTAVLYSRPERLRAALHPVHRSCRSRRGPGARDHRSHPRARPHAYARWTIPPHETPRA